MWEVSFKNGQKIYILGVVIGDVSRYKETGAIGTFTVYLLVC